MVDANMSSQVEFFLSAKGLQNKDTFSKTDAFCGVSMAERGGAMRELGRTETIWDSLNPKFTKQFKTTYHFEMIQNFKIALYDRDAKTERLSDHDFLGEARHVFAYMLLISATTKRGVCTMRLHSDFTAWLAWMLIVARCSPNP